jgi:hypothetical protein
LPLGMLSVSAHIFYDIPPELSQHVIFLAYLLIPYIASCKAHYF